MTRKGYKTILVREELYDTIADLARLYGCSLGEMIAKLYSGFVARSYAPFAEFRGLFRKGAKPSP